MSRRSPGNVRAARVIARLTLPVALVGLYLLYRSFGLLAVPAGMDTLPATHPPGTVCLVEKRPSAVVPGAVVFLDLEEGGTLLLRVERLTEDGRLVVAHDNPRSRFAGLQGEALGPQPLSAVRGLVLAVFGAEADGGDGLPGHGR